MADLFNPVAEMAEDTLQGRFLTFIVGKETYGIAIRFVTEIVGLQTITEMPEMPEYIKGIINLRGKIIPVMDVRLRFSKQARDYDDRTCVVVIDFDGISIGLIVDSVSEVMSIPAEDISELPGSGAGHGNRYIRQIGKIGSGVILLIDCEKLLSSDELEQLEVGVLTTG